MVAAATMVVGYLPQTIKAIRTRSTDDIAMTSFLLITIGALLFMAQGLLTGNYYLAVANFLTSCMSTIVVIIKLSNDRKKHRSDKRKHG
jgi:MtN3 and saliva related transmembrane protein